LLEPHLQPSFFFFSRQFHYAVQTGIEFMILLPQPTKGWYYRHAPPCLAQFCFIFRLSTIQFHVHATFCLSIPLWMDTFTASTFGCCEWYRYECGCANVYFNIVAVYLSWDCWIFFFFFLQYWALNSEPTPWATPPALFLWWVF
jgi:hypothetical protein